MRVAVIQLNNNIRGIDKRLNHIDRIIKGLGDVDLVILPELSTPGYIPNIKIWDYAEKENELTYKFAIDMCRKYNIFIGCGFIEKKGDDYFNSYIIAGPDKVYGICRKSEGESNIFKRGNYSNIITTPFGKVAVGICFDSHRESFYKKIKNENVNLIILPHGQPININKIKIEKENIKKLCAAYAKSFNVPVIYCNCVGDYDGMAGITGRLMNPNKWKLLGNSCVSYPNNEVKMIDTESYLIFDIEINKTTEAVKEIKFYNGWFGKGNSLYRNIIYKLDINRGVKEYNENKKRGFYG